jgi:hypothetical protein
MTQPRVLPRILLAGLFSAWLVDFLFWGHSMGVSLVVWMVLTLAAGFAAAYLEQTRPARATWILAGLAVLFAAVPLVRREPFTNLTAFAGAFGLLLLLAATFRGGFWPRFRLWDYFIALLETLVGAIARPFSLRRPAAAGEGETAGEAAPAVAPASFGQVWGRLRPYLLGLVLALPVVLIFAGLLGSADPIFAERWGNLFNIFNIEKLPEYIFRGIYILVLAFLFTGVLLHALFPLKAAGPDVNQAVVKPFLGFTETMIILGAVVLLFAAFLSIQFQYLFGGQANITATSYTYAEYARRGFNELVGVAVLSLGLYLMLDAVARRSNPRQERIFRAATTLLLGLVLVILGSALMRLMLYQQAYGFTRLRLQTLIFIPWLGALLLAAIVLILFNVKGRMGLALFVMAAGFTATVAILNMDGTIVRANLERARAGEKLDGQYLVGLSTDAVPAMVSGYLAGNLPDSAQQQLGAALACRAALQAQTESSSERDTDWRAFNFSQANAVQLLTANAAAWAAHPVQLSNDIGFSSLLSGQSWMDCQDYSYLD